MPGIQEWTVAWMRRWVPCVLGVALPLVAHADNVTDLMERGRWKDARAAVLGLKPGEARTLYLQSRVQLVFGQREAALASAEKAVALEPKVADYHYQLAATCGSIAQRSGQLKAFGLARRLRKEAELALSLDPKHLDSRELLVDFYSIAPGIVGGDKSKAATLADEIVRQAPARGYIAKAELALRAKAEAKAESLYLRAVEADPSSYDARLSLARLYGSDTRNRWDLVERQGRAAMASDPGRAGAYSVMAAVYVHSQRWDDLESLLAEAGRRVPGNLSPQYQAARMLIVEHRDSTRAERYLRQYLGTEPEGGAPTFAHARWRLGQALELQGRKAEAIAELEAAVKIDPGFKDAWKDLKRMKKA